MLEPVSCGSVDKIVVNLGLADSIVGWSVVLSPGTVDSVLSKVVVIWIGPVDPMGPLVEIELYT